MEIKCARTFDKRFHLLTSCIVTEKDGTKRNICPLFYGQMIREYNGRFFYVKEMPIDYFKKAASLESLGWATWYHYDNWINLSEKNNDYSGIKTDDAIEKINGNASDETQGVIRWDIDAQEASERA